MYRFQVLFCLLLLFSCGKNTQEDATKRYKKAIENKIWCEQDSHKKIFFENGYCKQSINDSVLILGNYKLLIEPAYGAGDWLMPNNKIKINTDLGNNYFFELQVDSDDNYLIFTNDENKTILFLSNDCKMKFMDSISYNFYKKNNYKFISLK
jgi:hypothetical protein